MGFDASDGLAGKARVRLVDPDVRFKLNWFSDATVGITPEPYWRVHELITEQGFVVLYSETKAGKTLAAIDLGCRIANGLPWHGLKTMPGVVVHLILEGQGHFHFRLRAWKEMYGPADDYCFVNVPVRFLEDADIDRLIADIKAQVGNRQVAMVIVDTVARAMGGGNENGPEDMGKFIASSDTIREKLGCALLALHHSGVDKSRSRGHTSLIGAADLVLKISKEHDIRRITIDYARDGRDDLEFGFKLSTVLLDNGMTVPAVADLAAGLPKREHKLSTKQKKCLDILRAEVRRSGIFDESGELDEMPKDARYVDAETWRDACIGIKHAIPERTFTDCRAKLEDAGAIRILYGRVWLE